MSRDEALAELQREPQAGEIPTDAPAAAAQRVAMPYEELRRAELATAPRPMGDSPLELWLRVLHPPLFRAGSTTQYRFIRQVDGVTQGRRIIITPTHVRATWTAGEELLDDQSVDLGGRRLSEWFMERYAELLMAGWRLSLISSSLNVPLTQPSGTPD